MIRTRFGNELKVIEPADSEGWVQVIRLSDNAEREYHASELRADSPEEFNQIVCGAEPDTRTTP